VNRVRDGWLRTNIGDVVSLDDAVGVLNPAETGHGENDHRRPPLRNGETSSPDGRTAGPAHELIAVTREERRVEDMKIAVIGGTGLIGSQVVKILNASGHEAVPHSPSTGLDLLSGKGLREALAGPDVVVNVTDAPTFDEASPAFFRTTMGNLLTAAESAGVGHAVVLSIVGADLVPDLVYYRAKVLQEDILKAGPVPYSIVRATQFFEFMDAVLSWTSDDKTVRLPATRIQPMAAADVARAVAEVCVGVPLRGTRNVAGPEVFRLDELGRITLAARGDQRTVVTDNNAGIYAAASNDVLIAKDDAVIAETTYRDWLAR
jgi:uncharacterized protein YbjT (DUF2867 family)